ncbi:hypothetical protein JCM24511_07347 [Saitozyma sp. JCM 24511]|nr:hypothetical protein JCM24511_07347 [Saitozyma sp. JCM 24511]
MSTTKGISNCGNISLKIPKPSISALCREYFRASIIAPVVASPEAACEEEFCVKSNRRTDYYSASAKFPVDPKSLVVTGQPSKYVAFGSWAIL